MYGHHTLGEEYEAVTQRLWKKLRHATYKQRFATVACTILVTVAFITGCYFTRPPTHFVLVLDSGSTGTRIHAYEWTDRFRQLPLLEDISLDVGWSKVPRRKPGDKRAYNRVETEPGLDRYIEDSKGKELLKKLFCLVEEALAPLLEWAEEVIPPQRWSSTPIFLFATAGLRQLPEEHQHGILDSVRLVLKASRFRFKPAWAKIISGEEEGIYGWIALNYLTGYLSPHPLRASHSASMETDADSALKSLETGNTVLAANENLKTVGALDMGGSSLEVTFIPAKQTADTVNANVSILGVQYNLYSQEHQKYGMNDAFDRSVELLLQGPVLRDNKNHIWVDFAEGLKASKVQEQSLDLSLSSKITEGRLGKHEEALKAGIKRRLTESSNEAIQQLDHPCLQSGYSKSYRRLVYKTAANPARVHLVGKPSWRACQELAALVVNATQSCLQPPCALGISQPPTDQPMYALTGFHVVYHFFGLDASASLDELEAKGQRYCDTEWDAIAAKRGAEVHVEHYCFRVPYLISLLRYGLGVPEHRIKIGTGREAWPLGAALAEGARAGAGLPRGVQRIPSRPLLIALSGVAILCWIAVLAWAWKPSSNAVMHMDRKASGVPHTLSMGRLHMPVHQSGSRENLIIPNGAFPASPTAVISGSNYSSNVARLSSQTNQRKRISSMDDLTVLR